VFSCFAALRHIRSIRRSICQPLLLSLVTSLALTRLDYGSVTLNGITKRLMDRLQSVLNAAATLVYNSRKYTTAFHHFCATCTDCASLNASSFVWPFLSSAVATRLHRTIWRETYSGQTRTTRGDDCDRRRLRGCLCVAHDYERSATAPSALLHRASGTTCPPTSFLHRNGTGPPGQKLNYATKLANVLFLMGKPRDAQT